jgi:hypothetical protein
MFGTSVEIEEPEELKSAMSDLVEELHEYYQRATTLPS